jgi:hypothetical protein
MLRILSPSPDKSASQQHVECTRSCPLPFMNWQLFLVLCVVHHCRCSSGVNFMLDWDTQGEYRLAALQSTPGRQLLKR